MFTAASMRSPFSGVCSLKVFRNMDSRPSLQSRHHKFSWATFTELVTTAFVINRIVFVDEDEALCRLADLLNHCDCDVYSPQPHSTVSEQISILQQSHRKVFTHSNCSIWPKIINRKITEVYRICIKCPLPYLLLFYMPKKLTSKFRSASMLPSTFFPLAFHLPPITLGLRRGYRWMC